MKIPTTKCIPPSRKSTHAPPRATEVGERISLVGFRQCYGRSMQNEMDHDVPPQKPWGAWGLGHQQFRASPYIEMAMVTPRIFGWEPAGNPCTADDMDFFYVATSITHENDNKTPFWEPPWLEGRKPKETAPLIFVASKRKKMERRSCSL